EPELLKEGRGECGRVHRRAHIVLKPGEREPCRTDSAADGGGRLEDSDFVTGAGERDGCGESVRPTANDRRPCHALSLPGLLAPRPELVNIPQLDVRSWR